MSSDQHTEQVYPNSNPGNGKPDGAKAAPQGADRAEKRPPDKPATPTTDEAADAAAPKGNAGNAANDADSAEAASEDLAFRLLDAQQQAEEHKTAVLRLQADMENLRRRSGKELEKAHKYALDGFIRELLPVKDSMELGIGAAGNDDVDITAIREGMALTFKMFASALEKFGVEEVSPKPGDAFDHERHQAISVQEDKGKESGSILTIIQKGCLLNGRLVRPAMVIVNK
uniref:Protein GrpE n=1 Tax=Candidatus Kentrum sp. DK TaxID=2126562 RepID=A0A450SC44_9GAMM|nr:MAG: molecular chaperone GrpE [Candidatus Kentron sp. DK]